MQGPRRHAVPGREPFGMRQMPPSQEMAYARQSGRRQEPGHRNAERKEGAMTAPTTEKGISWAARQGANDWKAGTACRKYQRFLRIYNLPGTQFTLRMWN